MNRIHDARQYAPATERNRQPILQVLQQTLSDRGTVLEIASGTGEHAVYFAPRLKPLQWLPSDPDPRLQASIAAWCDAVPSDNLHPPIPLDASESVWTVETHPPDCLRDAPIGAIVNINMIHIAPWRACLGLMAGANRLLPSGGILYLYGPYKRGGQHTAASNESFDASLRWQNPEWGIRDLDDVIDVAAKQDLSFVKTVEMPANNLSVVFRRN